LIFASRLSYDDLIDSIENTNKLAAQAQKIGNLEQAEKYIEVARNLFKQALPLERENPQAHLTLGIFMQNTHKWEESLNLFEAAEKLLIGEFNQPRIKNFVQQRKEQVLFRRLNEQQHSAYDEGRLRDSMDFALRKLEIVKCPVTHYEIGTLLSSLSASDSDLVLNAVDHFRKSHQIVFESWRGTRPKCSNKGSITTLSRRKPSKTIFENSSYGFDCDFVDENTLSSAYVEFESSDVMVVKTRRATLVGADGLIRTSCSLYIHSGDYFLNLAHQLRVPLPIPIEYPPLMERPIRLEKAASLIQVFTTQYYHFTTEVLARLIILLPYLKKYPEMKLIVPVDKSKTRFISSFLSYFDLSEQRLVYYETQKSKYLEVFRIEELYYAYWGSVHTKHGDELHCVTPKPVLIEIHNFFKPEVWPEQSKIVLVSRKSTTLRRWESTEQDEFFAYLQSISGSRFEVIEFEGSEPVDDMIALFRTAFLVVGVHGAGLSNVMFSQPGTHVIEFGFTTALALHFTHLSIALGHHHVRVGCTPGEKGFSTDIVKIPSLAMEKVKTVIENLISPKKKEL